MSQPIEVGPSSVESLDPKYASIVLLSLLQVGSYRSTQPTSTICFPLIKPRSKDLFFVVAHLWIQLYTSKFHSSSADSRFDLVEI